MSKMKISPDDLPSNLQEAMALAQMLIDHVIADGKNDHFRNKYATFEAVVASVKPHLNECGVTMMQKTHLPPEGRNGICVETVFMGYGEEISGGMLYMEAQAQTPQGYGSALTYAKRYSLATALCLPVEKDDDAQKVEIETRQKVIAKKAPVPSKSSGEYSIRSGEAVIAHYDTPEALYLGCREHMGSPKDLNCVAIFQKTRPDIEKAIKNAQDSDVSDKLQGVITAFGG